MEFRNLTANEIDCRVSTINKNGLTLLLYKDARCDMNILDETVKPEGWQRKHYECKGNLFCSVGIFINGEWIWKDDCGAESYTEKEKGESSDSFKRACFNWGIGRELYTAPFIWVSDNKYKVAEKNGKPTTNDRFVVSKIEITNKKITGIEIKNVRTNKVVYSYPTKSNLYNPTMSLSIIEQVKFEIRQTASRLKTTPKAILEVLENHFQTKIDQSITPDFAEVCITYLKGM